MFKIMTMVACVALAVGMAGCAGMEDQKLGSSIQSVLGNDFTGNYVKISGLRSQPADGKYPCLNQFEVCLGLDPEGVTAAIKDLCPSDNTPSGTWMFRYVIYADPACTEKLENLGCEPKEAEWLHPGPNHNDVACITRNASKTFDFCVYDPETGAGSEACRPCVPGEMDFAACNPI